MPRIAIYDIASKIIVGRIKMRDTRPAYIAFPDTDEGRAAAEAAAKAADGALMDAQIGPGQAWISQDDDAVASGPAYIDAADPDPAKWRQLPRPEGRRPTLDQPAYRIGDTVTLSDIAPGTEIFLDDVSQGVIDTGRFQFQTSGRGYHYLRFERFPDVTHDLVVKHNRKPRAP